MLEVNQTGAAEQTAHAGAKIIRLADKAETAFRLAETYHLVPPQIAPETYVPLLTFYRYWMQLTDGERHTYRPRAAASAYFSLARARYWLVRGFADSTDEDIIDNDLALLRKLDDTPDPSAPVPATRMIAFFRKNGERAAAEALARLRDLEAHAEWLERDAEERLSSEAWYIWGGGRP